MQNIIDKKIEFGVQFILGLQFWEITIWIAEVIGQWSRGLALLPPENHFQMVLNELGRGLTSALQKFVSSQTIDEKVI